jgi:phage terminase large subunit-like protein
LPPGGDWLVWLLLAGRGFGKTRTGAETVRKTLAEQGASRVALVGPTAADVRDVMVEGESGILATAAPDYRPVWEPSNRKLTWPDGRLAMCYSADEPDRLRGPQHDFAWCDELAAWRYPEAWDMLLLGLRLGQRPRVVVTTTPRPKALIRDLVAARTTVVTRGSTFDNAKNLAEPFLSVITARYEGTRLGRQELYAELLEQADGALWTRAMVEAARIAPADKPYQTRVVIAIDPAVTAGEQSDETGIIAAGIGDDGLVYVTDDWSGRFSPDEWARRAIRLFKERDADRIVGEVNNGGDLIATTLRTVDPNIAFKAVTASRGKRTRAEPVSALYEQRRVRHVGGFPLLEDQMCNWVPGGPERSPDRLDALVWAITELKLETQSTGALDFLRAVAAGVEAGRRG